MKKILILGAGRSSTVLISYLEENARKYGWEITAGDSDLSTVQAKVSPNSRAIFFDVSDEQQLNKEVQLADVVVSMLPARFHPVVARVCLKYSRSMLTASYVSAEISGMDSQARSQGILFLNETGVDPGIDHMSAMRLINRIREEGHELLGFESYTGGLVAPESDNNPWNYKITWNPRNVVLAGQGGSARFMREGTCKAIPYHRLFSRTELIEVEGYGTFEGYANRDSLKYIDQYNLQEVPTVYRGTLRRPGFCRAWDVFVQLGATDDSYTMCNTEDMSYKEFIQSFLPQSPEDSVRANLYRYLDLSGEPGVQEKLEWLGIFGDTKTGLKKATPAQILEQLICSKWALEPGDKDMLVMLHRFIFREKDKKPPTLLTSTLVVTGNDPVNTAMARTVGLPLGIATKLVLTGQIRLTGVHIPTIREIYEPILSELEDHGIVFREKIEEYAV